MAHFIKIQKANKKLLLWFGVMLALFSAVAPLAPAFAVPPTDFQTSLVVGDGLDGPSGFEIAPDGRIFILERTGKIKVFKNGQLLAAPFADLPSMAAGDRGLIGIAFDPDFTANHYVYFYYTGLDLLNHLVRFDASGDIGTDGPVQLFQTSSPSHELHVGGSIRFGLDGKMYFAVGDNGYPPNAQDLSNPHGKILRINKDGTIPTDNPFYGQPGKLGAIWAYGFRNPWRFQFDSQTGEMYGGDVGNFTWEEVNHITRGGNYGWPYKEGVCTTDCAGYTDPIYTYEHNDESAAVTGGPVYRDDMFPSEYQGNLFFGDYAKGFIKRAVLDENGDAVAVHDFDTTAGSVVDMKVGPDGALYYITYWPGRLYKVTYDPDNHIPVANATSNITKGVEPLTVEFSSTGSYDPDDQPITYLWDFGDGTTSTQANPTKTYTNKGVYTAKVTVSDGANQSQSIPIVIQVGIPPTVNIATPFEGALYEAGDTITYNAFANDAAGFDIDDADIKTEVLLHHHTHVHPFAGPLTGRAGSFTIPTTGEASADTWFEIIVTATDANGLTDTATRNVFPKKSQLTFATQPAGLTLGLDGGPIATPYTVEGVVGFDRELSAPPVTADAEGNMYHFTGWSDGGAIRHFVKTQATDTTYTANYAPDTAFVGEYFNNANLSGAPTLTRNDKQIDFLWGEGSPDPSIQNDNFSARWTKNQYFAPGSYKFTTSSDDGIRLYIDGRLVINGWNAQTNAIYTHTAELDGGYHELKVEYFDGTVFANARLNIDTATEQPASSFTGEYWNVPGAGTAPSIPERPADLTRQDQKIDFDWGGGSPGAPITNDHYIARWTRNMPLSGTYNFAATADDGVRLYVDGVKVIDKWIDQGPTTYTTTQTFSPGMHTVVMEYYENSYDAIANLQMTKTAEVPPPSEYQAEFWNTPGADVPAAMPTTPADATKQYPVLNFGWGDGSPDAAITNDHFVGRFTRTDTLSAGTYRFTGASDDGVRIYVDNQLVVNKWQNQNEAFSGDVVLQGGQHTIKVEYFENGGGAGIVMDYTRIGNVPPPTGFTGEYFANTTLTGPATITRTDSAIAFGWGEGSPGAALPNDNFSARWTKTQAFDAGLYRFTVTADDGVRLLVDGVNILDKWQDQSPSTFTVDHPMSAGNHTIVMEYYEKSGGAVAQLGYERIGDAPVQTGFTGEYFVNKTLTGAPVLTRLDQNIDFDWGWGSASAAIPVDDFSVRWSKNQVMQAGTYRFSITGDDGVRVYVDNQLVIDGWVDQGPTNYVADLALTAGEHAIRVEYYEAGGQAVAQFSATKL